MATPSGQRALSPSAAASASSAVFRTRSESRGRHVTEAQAQSPGARLLPKSALASAAVHNHSRPCLSTRFDVGSAPDSYSWRGTSAPTTPRQWHSQSGGEPGPLVDTVVRVCMPSWSGSPPPPPPLPFVSGSLRERLDMGVVQTGSRHHVDELLDRSESKIRDLVSGLDAENATLRLRCDSLSVELDQCRAFLEVEANRAAEAFRQLNESREEHAHLRRSLGSQERVSVAAKETASLKDEIRVLRARLSLQSAEAADLRSSARHEQRPRTTAVLEVSSRTRRTTSVDLTSEMPSRSHSLRESSPQRRATTPAASLVWSPGSMREVDLRQL